MHQIYVVKLLKDSKANSIKANNIGYISNIGNIGGYVSNTGYVISKNFRSCKSLGTNDVRCLKANKRRDVCF